MLIFLGGFAAVNAAFGAGAFNLSDISRGDPYTWSGDEDPRYLTAHLVLDGVFIVLYALFLGLLSEYVKRDAPLLTWILRAMIAVTVALDVIEDIQFSQFTSDPTIARYKLWAFFLTLGLAVGGALVSRARSRR